MDTLADDARYSNGNVGVSLAVGSDIVSDNTTTVGNTSHSICNGDGTALNTSTTVEEPLTVNGDPDMKLDNAVVANSRNTMTNSAAGTPGMTENQLPPGTIIFAQSDLNSAHGGGQFSGGHTAVVTGMDGECIAIFVQESLD